MANNTMAAIEFVMLTCLPDLYMAGWTYLEGLAEYLNSLGIQKSYIIFFLGYGFAMCCIRLYNGISCRQSRKRKDMMGINKIHYNKFSLIDSGGHGSKVYLGKFENIDVAVKAIKLPSLSDFEVLKRRLSSDNQDALLVQSGETEPLGNHRLMREVSINQAITLKNDFIVQYHGQEVYQLNKTGYLLIALELCKANLQDVVDQWVDYEKRLNTRQILVDLSNGLAFLHGQGIVHRDLKPSNILAKQFKINNLEMWRFKISDFGQSKTANFISDMGNFSVSGPYGSQRWRAPEVQQQTCGSSKEDIFSMGLVFYFTCTFGQHLFDNQDAIQNNTQTVDQDIKSQPVWDLINIMTKHDPKQRIPTASIASHPALWEAQIVLNFFNSITGYLGGPSANITGLENNHDCFQGEWNETLTPSVKQSLENRNYDFTKVKDLIRAIRNSDAHFTDSSRAVKREFGAKPEYFAKYWMKKFPKLLMHTYRVLGQNKAARKELSQFYKGWKEQ